MATYYVSWDHGADANNGLGPDASHATNKPWQTLGKALGAAGISSGDTVYVAPGSQREVVTVAMISATSETRIIGDTDNAKDFKNSSGVRLGSGETVWTAYTTNDTTVPSASTLLNLSSRDFLTFEQFVMVGGNSTANIVNAAADSNDIVFRDCVFIPGRYSIPNIFTIGSNANVSLNWLIDRCTILTTNNNCILITLPTSATADYDVNIVILNCRLMSLSTGVLVSTSGSSAFKGGGVHIRNCTIFATTGLSCNAANLSTTIPCTIKNSLIIAATGMIANTTGQIIENYNLILANTPRTQTSVGANSQAHGGSGSPYAPLFHAGQSAWTGLSRRHLFAPMSGSPLMGFGNDTGAPTVDFLNKPRPAGGLSTSNAVGYLERHDTGTEGAAADSDGGSGAHLVLTGPADQDLHLPVDAASTTVSVKVKWDSNHADTNKPRAILLANGEIGVTEETKTATGTAGSAYETLTFAAQTPTKKGWVTVRLQSRSAAGNGIARFDTVGVT